jgi:hypothetical protein
MINFDFIWAPRLYALPSSIIKNGRDCSAADSVKVRTIGKRTGRGQASGRNSALDNGKLPNELLVLGGRRGTRRSSSFFAPSTHWSRSMRISRSLVRPRAVKMPLRMFSFSPTSFWLFFRWGRRSGAELEKIFFFFVDRFFVRFTQFSEMWRNRFWPSSGRRTSRGGMLSRVSSPSENSQRVFG